MNTANVPPYPFAATITSSTQAQTNLGPMDMQLGEQVLVINGTGTIALAVNSDGSLPTFKGHNVQFHIPWGALTPAQAPAFDPSEGFNQAWVSGGKATTTVDPKTGLKDIKDAPKIDVASGDQGPTLKKHHYKFLYGGLAAAALGAGILLFTKS